MWGIQMKSEDKKMEATSDVGPCEIVENEMKELSILVTDEDKFGRDITKMSNFFEVYIQQLSNELSTSAMVDVLGNIPIADIGIINDVVQHAEVIMDGEYGYVPDFDRLPHDIKTKFQKGVYKIAESKQVDGNMRAVILDENDIRVKDITLKRIKNNPGTLETTRNIANQAQMRQIYAKLDDIKELQSYQIDRDRDRDIVTPFLNARSYILRAQNSELLEDRKECLEKAADELTTAINAAYSDLSTSSKHLVKLTRWPIFQRPSQINNYMGYLILDLQWATKLVGMQMHVFEYLGDTAGSKIALEEYQHVMHDFLTESINQKNQSAAILIHQYYPYNQNNQNYWIELATDMNPLLQAGTKSIEGKEILLVSVEGAENEEYN